MRRQPRPSYIEARFGAPSSAPRFSSHPLPQAAATKMKLVECVPNFSEGRRPEVVTAIRDAIAAVEGVALLDVSSDASHNRTVITFVAPSRARRRRGVRRNSRGARPDRSQRAHAASTRAWARRTSSPSSRSRARRWRTASPSRRSSASASARSCEIPVFLYERAATRPERENLADVRRGEFEGIRDEIGDRRRESHSRLRPVEDSPDRRRGRDRRAALSRRVQRLPRTGIEPSGREERREGGARVLRRTSVREGTRPRGGRTGAGLDESRRHREDAALSRLRRGEDGSGGAGRFADVERDRRTRARARAVRDRGPPHPAPRLQAGDRPREQGARGSARRRVGVRIHRVGRVVGADSGRRQRRRPRGRARRRARADGRRTHRWAKEVRRRRRRDARARTGGGGARQHARRARREGRQRVRRRRPRRTSCRPSRPTLSPNESERSTTRSSARPKSRSRPRAPARRSPSWRRRARRRETRTRSPTPASPRSSPTPPVAARCTTSGSTSPRSTTSHAARVSSPRQINCSRRRAPSWIRRRLPSRPRSAEPQPQLRTATTSTQRRGGRRAAEGKRRRAFFERPRGAIAWPPEVVYQSLLQFFCCLPYSAKSADSAKSLQY